MPVLCSASRLPSSFGEDERDWGVPLVASSKGPSIGPGTGGGSCFFAAGGTSEPTGVADAWPLGAGVGGVGICGSAELVLLNLPGGEGAVPAATTAAHAQHSAHATIAVNTMSVQMMHIV